MELEFIAVYLVNGGVSGIESMPRETVKLSNSFCMVTALGSKFPSIENGTDSRSKMVSKIQQKD